MRRLPTRSAQVPAGAALCGWRRSCGELFLWLNSRLVAATNAHRALDATGAVHTHIELLRGRRQATARAAERAGAVVVDPVPWFCGQSCPPIIGNAPAYHDDDHISATYAAQLAPLLDERLGAALRGTTSGAG